jgi:hypothetical protein
LATPAYADGIDIGAIFTGVDSKLPAGEMTRLICLLMLLNYALNFAVIGIPAVRVGPTSVWWTSLDLIWLTLLAQIADRAGSLLALAAAFVTSIPLSFLIGGGEAGLAVFAWLILLFSLFFCGYFVWVLAFHFLRKRWQSRGAENRRRCCRPD